MAQTTDATVTFNVGGQHYEVLRLTIESRPSTLLASLLDDIASDSAQPLFVDANPDRFAYILDWYRFGEIHLPEGFPTKAILNDARFFLLPDSIEINGVSQALQQPPTPHDAAVASITDAVMRDWPTFEQYVTDLTAEVQREAEAVAVQAKRAENITYGAQHGCFKDELIYTRKTFLLRGFAWRDEANVCSIIRLKILVAELKRRGFHCDVRTQSDQRNDFLQDVVLNVGLGKVPGASRVQIDGVGVAMGRLQVCSHNANGKCLLCGIP
mmetsp:Transcript_49711/g.115307  ORF Transcript_49711/g.115307 Transcript_49711/m.115307 type:complete len:269 (+) Transcript_49711:119-925(+)